MKHSTRFVALPRHSRNVRGWLVILAAVAIAAGAACGDDADDGEEVAPVDEGQDDQPDPPEEPPEQTTTAPAEPQLDDVTLSLAEIGEFNAPMSIVSRPGDTSLFVAEREGRVVRLDVTGEGLDRRYTPADDPVADISDEVATDGEQGLLDIEFSPDGERLYLSYSITPDGDTRIISYAFDGGTVDTGSRREVLAVDQPFANHNGGDIEFGPDDYLHFGLGDGGSGGDPMGNGQDTSTLLGSMLRIDPQGTLDGDEPYAIPNDNPFADGDGEPEIWLYGVRNPWRFTFDSETDDLWIADVGQSSWEEINLLPAADGGGRGANLGWNEMEGTHSFEGDNPPDGVLPVFEYPNPDEGCSVTGGVVYRGSAIPGLTGAYLFGDLCNPTLRALDVSGDEAREVTFDAEVGNLVSFGQDNEGEVYAVSLDGPIYRLDP